MAVEIIARLTGFSLSPLMCENEQTNHQAGLLMGYVNEECLKTVTDADMESIRIKKYINVTGSFPINDQFFDNIGNINYELLHQNLIGNLKNIVGWYQFRRNTNIRLTLREKLIHKNLCNCVEMPVEMFIFGVLTAKYSTNNAVHKYSQCFYRYDYTKFMQVPLTIPNLGEPFYSYKCTSKSSETSSIRKIIKDSIDPTSNENSLIQLKNGVTNHIDHLLDERTKLDQQIKTIQNTEPRLDDSFDKLLNKTSEDIEEQLNKKNNPLGNKTPIKRRNKSVSNSDNNTPVTGSPAANNTPVARSAAASFSAVRGIGSKKVVTPIGINTRTRRSNLKQSHVVEVLSDEN